MMPFYDYRCDDCDKTVELFHKIEECGDGWLCLECDREMYRVPQPTPTIGPMPSKPMRIGGDGTEVHSNAELRAYEEANPNTRVVSQDDSWWKNHKDQARERAENVARKMGYVDLDQKRSKDREAKKKGKRNDLEA